MRRDDADRFRSANAILPDACAFAAILLLFGFTFYLNWDFWDDQAAQAYMAWGLFHGMRPYVDLVDPNWPGILLPHALAYLISGTSAWGLRALDLVFAFAMLMATSLVLANWRTPLPMRVLAGSAYLITYFATGWMWTAQRESFCWPLFVIGAIPYLLVLGPRDRDANQTKPAGGGPRWFWFGIASGLSLWIKPSPVIAVVALAATAAILCGKEQRNRVLRGIGFHLLGIAVVSLLFLVALWAMGELAGFFKWGIQYDLGPYAKVKFPLHVRLYMMDEFFTELRLRQVSLLLVMVGSVIAVCLPAARQRWRAWWPPFFAAIVLVFTGALSVLLQGKPGSLYHFIPLDWALAFLAAGVWSILPWVNSMRTAAWCLAIIVVAFTVFKEPHDPGVTAGTIAGEKLNASLGPDDEIVEWGYSPSLLLRAQRRTPFMTFIGTAFLITTPPDSWAAREVLDRLNNALRDPSVRYLLVDRLPNYQIQRDTPKWPRDYLQMDPALRETLRTQYRELPGDTLDKFQTFIHLPATPIPASS